MGGGTRGNIENEFRRTPRIPVIYVSRRYGCSVYGYKRKFSLLANVRIYGGTVVYGRNAYGIDCDPTFVSSRRINRPTEIRFELRIVSYLFANEKQQKLRCSRLSGHDWNTLETLIANPSFRIHALSGFECFGVLRVGVPIVVPNEKPFWTRIRRPSATRFRANFISSSMSRWNTDAPYFPCQSLRGNRSNTWPLCTCYTLRTNAVCTANRKMGNDCNKTITRHTRSVRKVPGQILLRLI